MIAKHARGEIDEDALPRDMLTVLLRNEDRLELPPDLLWREIAFYLQAGSHSTANSTVHAMHNIFQWMAVASRGSRPHPPRHAVPAALRAREFPPASGKPGGLAQAALPRASLQWRERLAG